MPKNKAVKAKISKEAALAAIEERKLQQAHELAMTPMVGTIGGHSGHHCLHKDAAKTHSLRLKCFDDDHMAVCPTCKRPAARRYGCKACHIGGKELITLKESEAAVKAYIDSLKQGTS